MRLKEIQAKTPQQLRIDALKRSADTAKDTYKNVKVVPEVVINVVNYDLVHQMSLASSPYSPEVSEFDKAGLTAIPSETIQPFRVGEAPVQFECKVIEVKELGHEGGAGNLIICEVLRIHVREDLIDANGLIDQHKIDLVARMGGNWYSRSNVGMFEVEKPTTKIGIGYDAIPKNIRLSKILTGNHLGQLGNVETLPVQAEIEAYQATETMKNIIEQVMYGCAFLDNLLHAEAAKLLNENKA